MGATIDFGIDLGTTNSSIAVCRNGEVRLLPNAEQSTVTPSVVYISADQRMLVGKKAYDTWVNDPQNTQAEFKRWMGFNDRLTFAASGKSMSAEELSAEVLKALRADAVRDGEKDLTAAVITVPAAFGILQCDATARAAKLAGFEQAALLQEPIAAAIAYGAGPSSRNQRWMVFDLGGGTLDIAVVSTRNGRLAVLEHQGDNRLGGKDMDRLVAEAYLLEPLKQRFALPDRQSEAAAFDRFFRALVRRAEQAKIALTAAEEIAVELFDLGTDRDGKTIELSVQLTRGQVEAAIAPLVERCVALAQRSLDGARLAKADLDRLLLVGGPTQMPSLRAALGAEITSKLDYSIDPMTVVSQGAAFYASTLPRTWQTQAAAAKPAATSAVKLQLSHEPSSGLAQSPVAGAISGGNAHEIKIDAEGGFWTSGWVALPGGRFALEVLLNDRKPVTRYAISARDKKGRAIAIEPAEFAINYMLPMAAPPIPHTIAVELTDLHGKLTYDPVFKRHSPLPAEARRTYKADRTLRPSEPDTTLPIKFWEIDISDDPRERWWAGCVHVRADRIKRPILEGSDLELTIKIDASRKMTVEVFVPLLNDSFVDGVYIPDAPSARSQLQAQLDQCFDRIGTVRRHAYENDRDDVLDRANQIQMKLEAIAEESGRSERRGGDDPDAALGPTDQLRKLRIQIAQLEERLEVGGDSALARKVRADARWTDQIVQSEGNEADKAEMRRLMAQVEKYADADDPRGLKWAQEQMGQLRIPILNRLPWFWNNCLNFLRNPGRRFVNQQEARKWIQKAEQAQSAGNLAQMRESVNHAWTLLPPDKAESAREQAAQSGLRGT